jgi:hypothetical protein
MPRLLADDIAWLPHLARLTLAGAAALSTTLLALPADAAPSRGNKRFRFHGETDLLNFAHINPDAPGDDNTNLGGFGIGRPTFHDAGAFPGRRPMWGVGFGYVFAKDRAVVGGRLSFIIEGQSNDEDGNNQSTVFTGQLAPYFRWIFLPGSRFRPFVEGHVGVGGTTFVTEDDTLDTRITTNVVYPIVGFGGGLHIFPTDFFSVDLGIMFDYFAPHVRTETETPAGSTVDGYDKVADVINLAIVQLGFSVWF